MRDCAGLGPSVRFTSFHTWMGQVREFAIRPIIDHIATRLATGRWGMVTNRTELRCFAPAGRSEAMECRMRVHHEPELGVIDLSYDWQRVDADGARTPVARSTMRTSWVRVIGHGAVKAEPLPDFFCAYLGAIQQNLDAPLAPVVLPPALSPGRELRSAAHKATPGMLYEEEFQTTHEDGNLVGNIYFDRYALWQSKVRDAWFYRRAPGLFAGPTPSGEWFATDCRIEHLREAMPFDRVAVTMGVRAVSECGASLQFDYFRVDAGGARVKLAVAHHDAVWVNRTGDGVLMAAPIPEALRVPLLEAAQGGPLQAQEV